MNKSASDVQYIYIYIYIKDRENFNPRYLSHSSSIIAANIFISKTNKFGHIGSHQTFSREFNGKFSIGCTDNLPSRNPRSIIFHKISFNLVNCVLPILGLINILYIYYIITKK